MKRITLSILLLVIFGFFAFISVMGFLFHRKSHILLKTNRFERAMVSKKDIFSWLKQAAGIYLFDTYLPTWKKGVQPTHGQRKKQLELLHYTLDIEHIVDTDPTKQTNHEHPTIYLHGWGDTKQSAKLLKAYCDVLPGDIVTFNFQDSGILVPKWKYSNMGQLPDVLSTIYTIKWTKDNVHAKAVDLFGYSRGGATLLNTLAVLNDTSGAYDIDLECIGVTPRERKAILAMIQRGCHVLDCPLTDMNVSINELMKYKKVASTNNKDFFLVKAFEGLTCYKCDGLQGLSSAESLSGLKLNILMHFQYKDTMVSNKNEAELYRLLYSHNPCTTFIVLGNNGGHLHSHAALANTIHTFKQMFSSSYDPEYVAQYAATKYNLSVANRLLRPGHRADQTIAQYYEQCRKDDARKKIDRPS